MSQTVLKPILSLLPIQKIKAQIDYYLISSINKRKMLWPYLQGQGIEVGALHLPFPIPPHVKVSYVDRLPIEELQEKHQMFNYSYIVKPDIVDNAETLSLIEDNSQNFVIASHVIEHCQNPILTIKNFLRVTKPNGFVILAVPDQRFTYDKVRPITNLDHVLRDYEEGPEWSQSSHCQEWVDLVEKKTGEEALQRIQYLIETNGAIHFHVWTPSDFEEILLYCKNKLSFPLDIELFLQNNAGSEFFAVLRKCN